MLVRDSGCQFMKQRGEQDVAKVGRVAEIGRNVRIKWWPLQAADELFRLVKYKEVVSEEGLERPVSKAKNFIKLNCHNVQDGLHSLVAGHAKNR